MDNKKNTFDTVKLVQELPSPHGVRPIPCELTDEEDDNRSVVTLSSWSGETCVGKEPIPGLGLRKSRTEGSGLDRKGNFSLPLLTAERKTKNGVAYIVSKVGVASEIPKETLLLVHGTGLNAGTWDPAIAAIDTELNRRAEQEDKKVSSCDNLCGPGLQKQGPEIKNIGRQARSVRIIAVDWYGHGKSTNSKCSEKNIQVDHEDWYDQAVADVHEVLTCENMLREGRPTEPIVGVGHSVGSGILIGLETKSPGTFTGIVLFEPILKPRNSLHFDEASFLVGAEALATQAEQRTFPTLRPPLSSVGRQLRGSGAYNGIFEKWRDQALDAFAQRAFVVSKDRIVPSCPQDLEATTFRTAPTVLHSLDHRCISCPIAIAAGARSAVLSHCAPAQLKAHPDATLQLMAAVAQECQLPATRSLLPGIPRAAWRYPHLAVVSRTSHFLPMEQPTFAAKFICEALLWSLSEAAKGPETSS